VIVDEPSVQKLVTSGRIPVSAFVAELNDAERVLELLTRVGVPKESERDATPEQVAGCSTYKELNCLFSSAAIEHALTPERLAELKSHRGLTNALTKAEGEALNYRARYETKLRHRRIEILEAEEKEKPWLKALGQAFGDGDEANSNDGVKLTVKQLRAVVPLAAPTKSGHRPKLTPDVFQAMRIHPGETDMNPLALDGDKRLEPLASYNGRVKAFGKLCDALLNLDLTGEAKHNVVEGWHFADVTVMRGDDLEKVPMLHFSSKAVKSSAFVRVPTIMLDATANDELVEVYAPGAFVQRIEAKADHAKVIVHRVSAGKSTWTDRVDGIDALASYKAAGLPRDATGVICPKEAADAIRQRYRGEDGTGEPPYLILHHGALLGRNCMEEVASLSIFGRPLAASADIAKMATALTGKPVEDRGVYTPYAGWAMKSGGVTLGRRYGSEAGGVSDALVREITESGLRQAIGRARGCRRTGENPVVIEVFSDCVFEGEPVDEVIEKMDFDDAIKGPPWRAVMDDWLADCVPINRSNRFWQAELGIERTAWNHRRQEYGGLDLIEADAKARARADKTLPVVKFTTSAGDCIAVDGVNLLTEKGYQPVLLSGEARRMALREQ
jgi:hypothetical protein